MNCPNCRHILTEYGYCFGCGRYPVAVTITNGDGAPMIVPGPAANKHLTVSAPSCQTIGVRPALPWRKWPEQQPNYRERLITTCGVNQMIRIGHLEGDALGATLVYNDGATKFFPMEFTWCYESDLLATLPKGEE